MSGKMQELWGIPESQGLDALFIVSRANQRYLEGFTGADCFMLASREGNYLIAD